MRGTNCPNRSSIKFSLNSERVFFSLDKNVSLYDDDAVGDNGKDNKIYNSKFS